MQAKFKLRSILSLIMITLSTLTLLACDNNNSASKNGFTICNAESDCDAGYLCQGVIDDATVCIESVVIVGKVIDTADNTNIANALVQVADNNDQTVGQTAQTNSSGDYEIEVPRYQLGTQHTVLLDNNNQAIKTAAIYTLRAQAVGFDPFPKGLRIALPINTSSAQTVDDVLTIENDLTTIGLDQLAVDPATLGTIHGTVEGDNISGILVVAEINGVGYPTFSDQDGHFTIFNLPPGAYTVHGYTQNVQLTPANATVVANQETTGVSLKTANSPLSTISGTVSIVNAPGGLVTSVILVPQSLFDPAVARGSAPSGMRIGNVSSAFSFTGVPNGNYVILAAFENDQLVRDPDTSQGNTAILEVTVPDPSDGNVVDTGNFKVTEALEILSPGDVTKIGFETITTTTPTFIWADDSGEEGYELVVVDSFGNTVFSDLAIPAVTGSATVSYPYPGEPALNPGEFYQFRVKSFKLDNKDKKVYLSASEDLLGVFLIQQ